MRHGQPTAVTLFFARVTPEALNPIQLTTFLSRVWFRFNFQHLSTTKLPTFIFQLVSVHAGRVSNTTTPTPTPTPATEISLWKIRKQHFTVVTVLPWEQPQTQTQHNKSCFGFCYSSNSTIQLLQPYQTNEALCGIIDSEIWKPLCPIPLGLPPHPFFSTPWK